jgi:hypothetical protein
MKDFTYYSGNEHAYPDKYNYKKYLISCINDEPLTKAEREEKLKEVPKLAQEWFNEEVKPYFECQTKRIKEFWEDVRVELNYGHWSDKVIELIEAKAWKDGHANGFSEVHNQLGDLVYFVNEILKAVKKDE